MDVERVIEGLETANKELTGTDLDVLNGIDIGWVIEDAINTIRELQEQIPKWHLVADGDLPTKDIEECILVVNGKYENVTYINAVVQGGEYFDGRFYINGIIIHGIEVIAWRELPKFEREGRYEGDK